MRALRHPNGVLPRGYLDHRTTDGRLYTSYLRAILDRLGPLPKSADPSLREVGRLVVELQVVGRELDVAKTSPKRRRDVARLRRQMVPMRTQLITLERRLEELATDRPTSSLTDFLSQRAADNE